MESCEYRGACGCSFTLRVESLFNGEAEQMCRREQTVLLGNTTHFRQPPPPINKTNVRCREGQHDFGTAKQSDARCKLQCQTAAGLDGPMTLSFPAKNSNKGTDRHRHRHTHTHTHTDTDTHTHTARHSPALFCSLFSPVPLFSFRFLPCSLIESASLLESKRHGQPKK